MIEQRTEWAPMRDGIRLASDIYAPVQSPGPLPVVMMRNPYNGGVMVDFWPSICRALAVRGYVVVNQDARGTHRSEGSFGFFAQEQADGYDAVEWAAARPWSNGQVGLWESHISPGLLCRPPSCVRRTWWRW